MCVSRCSQKVQLYQRISNEPKYVSVRWIANVLFTGSKPGTRLKALVRLVDSGHEISSLDFIMPYQGLRVDGNAVCTAPLLDRGEIVEYTNEWYRR